MSRRVILAITLLLLALLPQPQPLSAGQQGEGHVYELGYGLFFDGSSGPAVHTWAISRPPLAGADTVDFSVEISLRGGLLIIELLDANNNTISAEAVITPANISLGSKSMSILPARWITVHLRYLRSGWAALYLEWEHRVEDMLLSKAEPWPAEPASIRVTVMRGTAILKDPSISISPVEPEIDESLGHVVPQMVVAAEGFSAELYTYHNILVTRAPDGHVIDRANLGDAGAPLPSYDYYLGYKPPSLLDARNISGSRLVLLEASRFNMTNEKWEAGLLLYENGSPTWIDIDKGTAQGVTRAWILGRSTLLLEVAGTFYLWHRGTLTATSMRGPIVSVDATSRFAVVLSSIYTYGGNTHIVVDGNITQLPIRASMVAVSGDMVALAYKRDLYIYNVSSGEWSNHTLASMTRITALDVDKHLGVLAAGQTDSGHAVIAEIRGDNVTLHNETQGLIPVIKWRGELPSYILLALEGTLSLQRVTGIQRETVLEAGDTGLAPSDISIQGSDPRIIVVELDDGMKALVTVGGITPLETGSDLALAALAPAGSRPPAVVLLSGHGLLLTGVSNGAGYTWSIHGLAPPEVVSQPQLDGDMLTFALVTRISGNQANYTVVRVNTVTGTVSVVEKTLVAGGEIRGAAFGASEDPSRIVLAVNVSGEPSSRDITYYIINAGSGDVEWTLQLSSITGPIPGQASIKHAGALTVRGALTVVAGITSGDSATSILARAWSNGSLESTSLEDFLSGQGMVLNVSKITVDSVETVAPSRGGRAAVLAGLRFWSGEESARANLLVGISPEPWLVEILPGVPVEAFPSLDGITLVLGPDRARGYESETRFYNSSLDRVLSTHRTYNNSEIMIFGEWLGIGPSLYSTLSKSWGQALPHPQNLMLLGRGDATSIPYESGSGRLSVLVLAGWLPSLVSIPGSTAREYLFYFDPHNRTAGTVCNDLVLTRLTLLGENSSGYLELQCNETVQLPEWAEEFRLGTRQLPGGEIIGLEQVGERYIVATPRMLDPAGVAPHYTGDRSIVSGELLCIMNESFSAQIGDGALQVLVGNNTYYSDNCIVIDLPPGNYTMMSIERSPTGIVDSVWITNLTILPSTGQLDTPLPHVAQTPPPGSTSSPPPQAPPTPPTSGPAGTTQGGGRHIPRAIFILVMFIVLIPVFYLYWQRQRGRARQA